MQKKIIAVFLGIAIILTVSYILFSYVPSAPKNSINSIEITYSGCHGCSNDALGIIKSLFTSYKIALVPKNVSFGTKQGISLVSNLSVTALPTLVLNETNYSTSILSSLTYLNVFNVENNYFVLNTPFLAGVSKGIKYFDIIQNRTITSFDIFNQSYVYGNVNKSVINPSEILYLFNGTNYTYKNKTEISFIYSNSSFSAVQSLVLYKALSGFGNFSNLRVLTSPTVTFSSGEELGGTEFYALYGNNYSSSYFYLESSYLGNLSSSTFITTLEKQLFEFDQNSAYPLFSNLGNFMPFIDIGGKYIGVSSMINPKIFEGKTIKQVMSLINTNQTDGEAFNDSVYFIQTLLCSYTGYNAGICTNSVIKNDLVEINSLT